MAPRPLAVLLPLRLETVLRRQAGATTLLVLVAPDVPWFDRHDPRVTEEELDDVRACWKAGGGGLKLEPFGELVRAHGGARATWLVRTFRAGFNRRSATLRPRGAKPRFPRIPTFPTHIEIWIGRGGGSPTLAKRQPIKVQRLVLDPTLPRGKRWWSDWEQAKDVGLGFEIDLGAGDPDDIDVIFAVGLNPRIGPKPLFTAHAAAGRLAIVPLGEPTNAVGAAPAIDLQGSVEEWFAVASSTGGGDGGLHSHLGGRNEELPAIRGFDLPRHTDGFLVAALWSALWGRVAEDVWQLGPGVRDVGRWAQRNLRPEGPLPAIRIDDQPYGLLPVTALEDWQPASGDPRVEIRLRVSLLKLRDRLARAAERRGNVRGANAREFLGLVGDTPVSGAYSVRWFLPLELLAILESAYGSPVDPQLLDAWWQRTASVPLSLAPNPARRYATLGREADLAIPLVEPLRFPKRGSVPLERLLETLAESAVTSPELLLFPARMFHEFHQFADGISGDELDAPDSLLIRLLLHSFVVGAARANQPSASLLDPPVMDTDFETLLAQALDSGDPWSASGMAAEVLGTTLNATRTLADHTRAHGTKPVERAFRAVLDTASHRVDPWITGIAWRRYVTLQRQGQPPALGAYGWVDGPLIGRDGPTEGGLLHAPSDLQARTAVVLRDKAISDPEDKWTLTLRSDTVRAARQLAEEVRMGAHPTEAVGRMVERAVGKRARIAAVRERFPAAGDEHGRRTCDGLAVLAPEADISFLTAAERKAVDELRAVLDAYADLLVADAVHKVVGGRMDLARPAMEAAAGMATPPELDVLRTPRRGRAATTSVHVVLPVPAGGAGGRPAKIADAAVAAYIDSASGGAQQWTWQVSGGRKTRVTLAEMGLAPADTLALSADALDRMAVAAAGGGKAKVTKHPPGPARAATLAAVVAGSPETAQASVGDLRTRLTKLTAAAKTLRNGLRAGPASRQLLLRAARWGISPTPHDDEPLASVLSRAAAELDARLERAPDGAKLSAEELTTAISELASAGRLPVLAHVPAGSVPVTRAVGKPAASRWLEVVAAVRPRLRALDSHQLGPGAFAVRGNRADLWQTSPKPAEVKANATRLELAFGPPAAFAGGRVAVSLVDRFVEVVPSERQATTAAFGFNAPAARAPQAILLAVPPVVDRPLDTSMLVRIVEETRTLARARMARPEDLDELAAALPSTLFPVARRGGVNLSTGAERWP